MREIKRLYLGQDFFLKAFYLHPVFEKDACIAYNYFDSILHVLLYVMSNVYPCFYRKS